MTDPASPMPRRPSEPEGPEVRAAFRATLARRLAIAATAIASLALVITVVYCVLSIRETQLDNTATLDSARRAAAAAEASSARIADCTTRGGECYERGQRNAGSFASSINGFNLAAILCGQRPEINTFALLQQCVNNKLRDNAQHPSEH